MVPNFARLGLPRLSMTLHKRAWATGKAEMGTVSFLVQPLRCVEIGRTAPTQNRFPRINIMDFERSRVTRFNLTVLAPDEPFAQGNPSRETRTVQKYIEQQTRRVLHRALKGLDPAIFETAHSGSHEFSSGSNPRIPIDIHTSEATSPISRLYILIVAHTSTGFRLGHDILGRGVSSGRHKGTKHGKTKRGQDS